MYDERFHIILEFAYAVWLTYSEHAQHSSLQLSIMKRLYLCPFFNIVALRYLSIFFATSTEKGLNESFSKMMTDLIKRVLA